MGKSILTIVGRALAVATFLIAYQASAQEVFSGKVLTPDGKAAAGATVRLLYCHESSGRGAQWVGECTADAQGDFSLIKEAFTPPQVFLRTPVNCLCLVAILPGYAMGHSEASWKGGEDYALWLEKGQDVTCTVLDQEDAPVEGADVWITRWENAPLSLRATLPTPKYIEILAGMLYRTKSDAQGKAILKGVTTGRVQFEALKEGLGEAHASTDGVQPAVSLTLKAGYFGYLRGRVVYADTGKPVSGAGVVDVQGLDWTVADENGVFKCRVTVPNPRVPLWDISSSWVGVTVCDPQPDSQYVVKSFYVGNEAPPEEPCLVELQRGRHVTRSLVVSETKTPVVGQFLRVNIGNALGNDDMVPTGTLYCRTDSAGSFSYYNSGDTTSCELSTSPEDGFVQTLRGDYCGERPVLEASRMLKNFPWKLVIRNPDGSPAVGAQASILQEGIGRPVVRANHRGEVQTALYARKSCMYVQSLDGKYAQVAGFDVPEGPSQVEITLRPAVTGRILFVGPKDDRLIGKYYLYLGDKPNGIRGNLCLSWGNLTEQDRETGTLVGPLLAGLTYYVDGDVDGMQRVSAEGTREFGKWSLSEDDKESRIEVRFVPREPMKEID